jgi:hypothetical protein
VELKSRSRLTNLRSRRPESRGRCLMTRRQRPRLPTCPLIPTASRRNRRQTRRVAPSLQDWKRPGPCKRELRSLASRGTSVCPLERAAFVRLLSWPFARRGSSYAPSSLGCSGGSTRNGASRAHQVCLPVAYKQSAYPGYRVCTPARLLSARVDPNRGLGDAGG